jgi:hypothetical protein
MAPLSERNPVGFGPELVLARGAVDAEQDRRRPGCRRRLAAQAEIRRAADAIPERSRRELARAIERVDVRLDAQGVVDQPACRPLVARALGPVGEPVAHATREPRDQRRLGEPLQVEDRVVVVPAQADPEGAQLAARRRGPPAAGPAPQRTLDDGIETLHPAQQRGKAGLDHPVDRRLRMGRADVVHHRHRVDDVAERRQLDDQDAHRRPVRCVVRVGARPSTGTRRPLRRRDQHEGSSAFNAPPERPGRRA